MPEDEGMALYELGRRAAGVGPLLEVGSWCGKSAIYLGSAAEEAGTVLFAVDHHRGSEELQAGWEHHDPAVVDPGTGRIDTLPHFRRTVDGAGLEATVIAVVGSSVTVARHWGTALGLVFVDGGHSRAEVHGDYEAWAPWVALGGWLALHDVFAGPAEGGPAPFEVYQRAVASGEFREEPAAGTGSLRALRRLVPADGRRMP